jgi:hypothetical protein
MGPTKVKDVMNNILNIVKKYNIPIVKTWNGNFNGITDFMEAIGGEEGCEGYIIRFENGHMVKLKNAWYLNLHRAKDQLSNEKNVYRLVLSEHHDDLLPQLDPDTRLALERFAEALSFALKTMASTLDNAVKYNWDLYGNRRDFALNWGSKQELSAVVFKILDGRDAYEALVDWLLAQTSTPAFTSMGAVSAFTPPSTSISVFVPASSIILRSLFTFCIVFSMNVCPPKPGFTLISSTMSTSSIISSSMLTGVAGFKVTAAFMPAL